MRATLHVGPANSGKTYHALEALKKAGSGLYLAPLRLLAWEIADKLNRQGHPCSLKTGEEENIVPNAPYFSSTVEMFDPGTHHNCIVLDESQMIADSQRGWAWMRPILYGSAARLEIVAAPESETLLKEILQRLGYEIHVKHYKRLAPLDVAEKPWRLDKIEPHTIFVVFSRGGVLSLKTHLESLGHSVAIIYGNLPPEVKKRQAERFASGDAKICVATDAIGMGINLPAARVCFTTMVKYDGEKERILTAQEARQIAGRAGRFGFHEKGLAGALNEEDLNLLHELLVIEPHPLEMAHFAPDLQEITKIKGTLLERLEKWEKYHSVPEKLEGLVKPADLESQKLLAGLLQKEEVQELGLANAYTLIKAPSGRDSLRFWRRCVNNLLADGPLPLPNEMKPFKVDNETELFWAENAVAECDIYLWIAQHKAFHDFAEDLAEVEDYKWKLVDAIDGALSIKMDLRKKCRRCFRTLPLLYEYSICERCHSRRFRRGSARGFRKQ